MNTLMRTTLKPLAVLVLVLALLGAGFSQPARAASSSAPAACLTPGTATAELWAKAGSATIYTGTSINIWGYATTAAGTPGLPGPTIIVNQGDVVSVNLTNNLAEPTSMLFLGQTMIPDTAGVAPGNCGLFTFTATKPGTFLYEAGLLSNAEHQVAMGLYGALIVRPSGAPAQAYGSSATAFNSESALVLSEYDPAIAANPAAFDMRNYHPRYFLINGKAYPGTSPIAVPTGQILLLRYINAGLISHAMSVVGLNQSLIAMDGSPFNAAHTVVSETIAPGQTLDTLVTIPGSVPAGRLYPLFDSSLSLRNSSTVGMGGMFTYINVSDATLPTDTSGPVSSNVQVTPNAVSGNVAVTVSADLSDAANGGSNVVAAEYFIDATAANGTGVSMTGTYGTVSVAGASAVIPGATIAALSSGNHPVYVHARDSIGNWGVFSSATLAVDNNGPITGNLSVAPSVTNGSVDVIINGTGDDSTTGNHNVIAAEYSIDGGAYTPMVVNTPAVTTAITAAIPAATVAALSNGTHSISVHSQDFIGLWGTPVSINLLVDKSGPTTGPVTASPNPNNGNQPYNISVAAVRVFSTLTDTATNISAGEGFIDTVGATGSGFPMIAVDGLFNSLSEDAYADIPLPVINALTEGNHTIFVHARDAAGNWGPFTQLNYFVIDKTAPTFSAVTVSPSPTYGATSVAMTIIGAPIDAIGGEYWLTPIAPAPGAGTAFSGTSATIPVGSLANGTYTVSARLVDAVGNWSTVHTTTLEVAPDTIFADGFETGNFSGWTSQSTLITSRLNVLSGAPTAMVGTYGMMAQGDRGNFVQYNLTGAAANTFDARFYFNPNGNTSTGKDIFLAASGSGTYSTAIFRVRYRYNSALATPQVQIEWGTTITPQPWVNINAGSNVIEVVWQASPSGAANTSSLKLYINGSAVASQSLTNANMNGVGSFRLGSVTASTPANPALLFDAFAAKHTISTLLGP